MNGNMNGDVTGRDLADFDETAGGPASGRMTDGGGASGDTTNRSGSWWTRQVRTAGAGLAVAGLLVGGVLGTQLHDALAGNASPTGTVAAPTLPSPAPPVPSQPNAPGQSGAGPATTPRATAPASTVSTVTPSVVDVYTTTPNGRGAGAGMILTASGDVLTNNHVIEGATSIRVVSVSTGRSYAAKVLGTAPTEDVALLHLTGASGLQPIAAAGSSTVQIGEAVVALGNAGGTGGAPSVVTGSVVATNRTITVSDQSDGTTERLSGLIQTNAPIQPGDSGGPLVDADAKVIGMDTAASVNRSFGGATTTSEGYAIPIDTALSIAEQIRSGKESGTVRIGVPARLGVSVAHSDATVGSGAQLAEVTEGSPAERAGLVAGDTITAVDGRSVTSGSALTTLIRSHRPGDSVRIAWLDNSGSRHTVMVQLAEGTP